MTESNGRKTIFIFFVFRSVHYIFFQARGGKFRRHICNFFFNLMLLLLSCVCRPEIEAVQNGGMYIFKDYGLMKFSNMK